MPVADGFSTSWFDNCVLMLSKVEPKDKGVPIMRSDIEVIKVEGVEVTFSVLRK